MTGNNETADVRAVVPACDDLVVAMIAARAVAAREEWLDELNPDEPGGDAATWAPDPIVAAAEVAIDDAPDGQQAQAAVQAVKDAAGFVPKPLRWTNGHLTHGEPWRVA